MYSARFGAVVTALCWQTYVMKLAKSGSDGEKVFLLLESGTRFHTVQVRMHETDTAESLSSICTHCTGCATAWHSFFFRAMLGAARPDGPAVLLMWLLMYTSCILV